MHHRDCPDCVTLLAGQDMMYDGCLVVVKQVSGQLVTVETKQGNELHTRAEFLKIPERK